MMPPESSQNLEVTFAGEALSFILSRARSTNPRGMPESGTGTATHSLRGFSLLF
jgi:hypothetical protein